MTATKVENARVDLRITMRLDQHERIRKYQGKLEQEGFKFPYLEAFRAALDIGLKQLGYPCVEEAEGKKDE